MKDDSQSLELADVPRRGRGGTMAGDPPSAPVDAARPTRVAPPTPPPRTGGYRAPGPGWGRTLLVLAVLAGLAYAGWYVYQRSQRSNLTQVRSPYRSRIGMTVDLPPGEPWYRDRTIKTKRRLPGGMLYVEFVARGERFGRDDEVVHDLVMLLRLQVPSMFARVDFTRGSEELPEKLMASAQSMGAELRRVACGIDITTRSGPVVVCTGEAETSMGLMVWRGGLWPAGPDDLIGVVYATPSGDTSPFEGLLRTLR